jgi:RES domain-containing protein
MTVFRIVREKYLGDALGGRGAQFSTGFRWNSFGTPMVYTAESRSLALLEIAVHLDLSADLPQDRYLVDVEIPDSIKILFINPLDLPKGWKAKPPQQISQRIGDEFVASGDAAVLRVPSAIIQEEHNYLLNPLHPDFELIRVSKKSAFPVDSRLGFST